MIRIGDPVVWITVVCGALRTAIVVIGLLQ